MCTWSALARFTSATSQASFAWLANTFSKKALKTGRSVPSTKTQGADRSAGRVPPQQERPSQVHLADLPVAAKRQVAYRREIIEVQVALQPASTFAAIRAAPRSASPARSGGPATRAGAAALLPRSDSGFSLAGSQPRFRRWRSSAAPAEGSLSFSWCAFFQAFFRLSQLCCSFISNVLAWVMFEKVITTPSIRFSRCGRAWCALKTSARREWRPASR